MITIRDFEVDVLTNENLIVKDARKDFGNDSVVNEIKLYDDVNNITYYFILNHLDMGPMQLFLLDKSIYNRLKRIGDYTAYEFIEFINEKYLDVDLDDYDYEELEKLPYGKALLTILMINFSESTDILNEVKGKRLKDVVIPEDFDF